MSNYSFMKTGQEQSQPEGTISLELLEEINILMSLFIKRGLKNAHKYMKLCNRNVITKMDISMGMKLEIMTFIKDPNLQSAFDEHKEEYLQEIYGREEEEEEEEENELDGIASTLSIPDSEIEEEVRNWRRLTQEEIIKLENDDKEFVRLMHNMTDHWEHWNPANPFEKILQNNIIKYF